MPLLASRLASRIAPAAAAFALLGSASACGGIQDGTPCEEIGAESCDGDALFRCDGEAWRELAPCHATCRADAQPRVHDALLDEDEEIWSCASGPHVVDVPLEVSAGKTLIVEAGAEVRLARGARLDTTPSSRLVLEGSEGAPVLVTSDDETQGGYGSAQLAGLNLFATDASTEPSVVQNAIIERGVHGLAALGLSPERAAPVIEQSVLRDHEQWGILLRGCQADAFPPAYESAHGNRFFANGEGSVSECQP